jgi:hypothetical protein
MGMLLPLSLIWLREARLALLVLFPKKDDIREVASGDLFFFALSCGSVFDLELRCEDLLPPLFSSVGFSTYG